ncbi:hypothetical protein [Tomitella gaofuii]|nr:hypothetical protein [Tomitella gaofuii]
MNPLRIPGFILRGLVEVVTENVIAFAELAQFAALAGRKRP